MSNNIALLITIDFGLLNIPLNLSIQVCLRKAENVYWPQNEQSQSYMDEVRTTLDVPLQVLCRPPPRLSLLLGSHFDGRASLEVILLQNQALNVAVHQTDSPGGGSVLLLSSRNSLDVFKLPRPPESRVQSPESRVQSPESRRMWRGRQGKEQEGPSPNQEQESSP